MASIDKHGKGYRVRVYYKDEVGKRRAITRTGIMSKAEARSVAKKLEADLEKTIKTHNAPTLYEYLQQYIETYRIGKVSVASVDIDKWSMKRLFSIVKINEETKERTEILLYSKDIRIDKITGTMHQQVINELFKHDFSISTIKKTNSLMYRAMERARFDGYISFNPAELIEYKITDKQKVAEYIPHDKIEPFLEDVKRRNVYHYFLFRLIIETGLRVGEACALTFDDIDTENNVIRVIKSYDQKRDMLGPTKTKYHRDVYITQALHNELLKLKQLHSTNAIINESIYRNKYNFIFVDEIGKPLSRSSIHNTMVYCSNKVIGIQLSVHKLRHTHATLLLEAGVPMKIIQDRLGHQSMEITERVYSHVTPKMKEDAMDAFNEFIKDVF